MHSFQDQAQLIERVLQGASEAIIIWMPQSQLEGEPNIKACVKLHNGDNSLLSPMLDTILSGLQHSRQSRRNEQQTTAQPTLCESHSG